MHWDGGGQGEELPQQGREEVVLAGSPGGHHLNSRLSPDGLQKLPREDEGKTIEAETAPCAKTREREQGQQEGTLNSVGEVQVG